MDSALNLFQDEIGQTMGSDFNMTAGLNLSPTDAPPNQATAAASIAPQRPSPTDGLSTAQKIGYGLEAVSALYRGDTPLLMKVQQHNAQQQAAKLQALDSTFGVAKKLIDVSNTLPLEKKQKFLESMTPQFESLAPGFGNTFKMLAEAPDRFGALKDLAATDPVLKQVIAADPSGTTFAKFLESEAGQKRLVDAADKKYLPVSLKKIGAMVEIADKYVPPEILTKIKKDGKTTVSELQEMNGYFPENAKLNAEEFSNITSDRNQKHLVQFGITTDSLAEYEAKQKAEASAKGDTNIKASDSNTILRLAVTNNGGIMDEQGNVKALDPNKQKRVTEESAAASKIYQEGKGKISHAEAYAKAVKNLSGEPKAVLPKGVPPGSKLIGTAKGKPVYEDPQGKRHLVQ